MALIVPDGETQAAGLEGSQVEVQAPEVFGTDVQEGPEQTLWLPDTTALLQNADWVPGFWQVSLVQELPSLHWESEEQAATLAVQEAVEPPDEPAHDHDQVDPGVRGRKPSWPCRQSRGWELGAAELVLPLAEPQAPLTEQLNVPVLVEESWLPPVAVPFTS